jgi:hypothetical protein
MFCFAVIVATLVGGAVWCELRKEWGVDRLGVELKPINPNKWTRESVWQAVINCKNGFAWTIRCKDINMANDEVRAAVLHVRHVALSCMRCGVLSLPKLALTSNVHRISYMACVRANYLEFVEGMDILISYTFPNETTVKIENQLLSEPPTVQYE